MARRIAYTGSAVLTVDDVAYQCRVDAEDLQPELIEQIIIPGVTVQAEQRTGAAIREATYEEDWPESRASGSPLDVGQASEVLKVERILPDGTLEELALADAPRHLRRGQRESCLHFTGGRPVGPLRITYKAGLDIEANPGVRNWMLMHAGSAYAQRETWVVGTILASIPSSYMDSLLADITVPPRF
ncbi:MAG TPA: hypothetical protein DEP32_13895 [Pseudomonas sp.]|nr:hypothetical protein [Pseudomonas sp.]MBB50260.1 hypothetical protein [Pseudomonadales bacterium]MBB50492.1 hypothetical protein [Pseudomonadales bacterium]HCA25252.1 hypothetical protein [Pseudomonas sp.]|tara:strand:+ start:20452 stop:21012 length:561 start_codon:yes stop_codon:yes gene_type:complete